MNQAAEDLGTVGVRRRSGRVMGGLFRGVAGEQRGDTLAGRRRRTGALDAELRQLAIHGRQRGVERAGLVGETELQRGVGFDHVLGALRIVESGELDDDLAAPELLDQRLTDAELIDALAQHIEGAHDGAVGVGDATKRRVEPQLEVHAALQIESQLDRHPACGRIVHRTGRVAHAHRGVARDEIEDRRQDHDDDQDDAVADG